MGALRDYLQGMAAIRATGEAVEETSYYGQLETLLNAVGGKLSPKVSCVLTTRNRGAGVPDGGLFISSRAVESAGREAMVARVPERGAVEVKGPAKDVRRTARTQQVRRYLQRYGKVLVTTYREFLVVNLGKDGEPVLGETFTLAGDENSFWTLASSANQAAAKQESEFENFLKRALLGDAPLSQPADLAWFLAAYAREARKRLDAADAKELKTLSALREAMQDGLGLRFEGEEGEKFFRSALVQTLFYGVFAAWVVWSESKTPGSAEKFTWKSAQWTLKVPMVRVLFQQLATPTNLPVGIDEVLDWTEDTLARVDHTLFFDSFESGSAVQYFYEPFLDAYDPDLRRQLGVWYTPPEVVRYMVLRVHQALQDDLGLELGLADQNVHILDPCTGTGSFLVEAIATVAQVLEEQTGDALVAQDTKQAALNRIHGFELLPAPFVIAHLNIGLALDRLGAPLSANERANVYLTNALTGWVESDEHPKLPFPEFEEERDAATDIKRSQPILVVLGNPPYNGFAGVSGREEGGLVDLYKQGLAEDWDITKNNLNDLYVRFFRVAERRIAEQTGKGIVCFISNFSWLGDPSAVVMRKEIVRKFDRLYVDNLNGDSRETGKKTPEGLPDPSVFSTKLNSSGIQVGTAISLLVRSESHSDRKFEASYRDFWGANKRAELESSLNEPSEYSPLLPSKENWYRLRRWSPRQGYEQWPAIPDLALIDPLLGLNENRGEALISPDREQLQSRMSHFLDQSVEFSNLDNRVKALTQSWSGFDSRKTRERLINNSPYDDSKSVRFCVKPFDLRWAYVDTTAGLWNRSRPELVQAAELGSQFLLLRRRAPRALDGAAFLLSRCLIDQHVMHKDAYVIPFYLATDEEESKKADATGTPSLFDVEEESSTQPAWKSNLSPYALNYLAELGVSDARISQPSAQLIWQHVLAIGYSPLYLEENGDAVRHDWPRVPLPSTFEQLENSARLGQKIAGLLDLDTDRAQLYTVISPAQVARVDGKPLSPEAGDLAVTANWASEQKREQKSGAVSRIVMPGRGRIELRERTDAERQVLADAELELLGSEVVDVYLNDRVCWRGVPEAVWDFKIGGFQVLRKWLSYRDADILDRDLTVAETRQFTSICLRLTEIVLMGPQLDENYIAAARSSQE
ncbi:N-6 DNA methylase [Streptomyces sp. SID1046]|uniref:type ISP restriction/modification enzyme n=1 Tax=Streptomyces sp. SID1046 TaxID=2690249 RepID=UPI00137194F1|nr:type ISP restriction/modification enzyme [Streptomyces sp. SID1046]MYV73191.1 N-6 DNA methylase [Streptomyces sp. SID1046]